MAVSSADFYAYSRATGAPVPEDPEERMRMAPEVLAFRRNQLRAPEAARQEEQSPLMTGVGIGLALAGAGAAAFGARRLMRGPKQSANAGVRQVNLAENLAQEPVVTQVSQSKVPDVTKLSTQAPSTTTKEVDVAQNLIDKYRSDYERAKNLESGQMTQAEMRRQQQVVDQLEQQEAQDILTGLAAQPSTRMVRRHGRMVPREGNLQRPEFSPRGYLEQKGSLEPLEDLTSVQQQSLPQVIDQKINAVESGEDQMTGRMKQQLQRNEDLDLSQIELLEDLAEQDRNWMMEQDEPINRAAANTPDGIPIDQAEGKSSATKFLERERMEIASQLGEQNLPITPSRIEQELTNRLSGSQAWTYGPKYTQRKQALQLGATYEPKFFENLKTPSVQIASETIPVELLKEPVLMEETAERLQEKINKKRDWLGQVRLEEQKNKVRLINVQKEINTLNSYRDEVSSFLTSGKATSEQARLGKQRLSDILLDLDRLDTQQNELLNQVYTGEKRIKGVRAYTEEAIAGLQLPQKLKSNIEEGQRVFFETDAAGNVIPETMELRTNRPMITTERKGGSGRNLAEYTVPERIDEEIRVIQTGGRMRDYDPETGAPMQRWQPETADVGRKIDIYGIRPSSEPPADPEMRPSKPGPSRTPLVQELTPERLASVQLSEAVRKGQVQVPRAQGPTQSTTDPSKYFEYDLWSRLQKPGTKQIPEPVQLSFPSDVVPTIARARTTAADIASRNLEDYLSKIQRGRSTPLASDVRIQPRLF